MQCKECKYCNDNVLVLVFFSVSFGFYRKHCTVSSVAIA